MIKACTRIFFQVNGWILSKLHRISFLLSSDNCICHCLSADYYAKDMLGLQIEQETLREVVR